METLQSDEGSKEFFPCDDVRVEGLQLGLVETKVVRAETSTDAPFR